jgi:hypothetical protein
MMISLSRFRTAAIDAASAAADNNLPFPDKDLHSAFPLAIPC